MAVELQDQIEKRVKMEVVEFLSCLERMNIVVKQSDYNDIRVYSPSGWLPMSRVLKLRLCYQLSWSRQMSYLSYSDPWNMNPN